MSKYAFLVVFMGITFVFTVIGCTPQSTVSPFTDTPLAVEGETSALKDVIPVQAEDASENIANTETSGGKIVVEVTPLSDELLAEQPMGQSEPSASEPEGEVNNDSRELVLPKGWVDYVDTVNSFKISYPNDYVAQSQDNATLAQFEPKPIASIFIMNPDMARGELAGIEPPDLSVRVFKDASVNSVDSLLAWLRTTGLSSLEGDSIKSYQNGNVNGVNICFSTLLAPGCSVFVIDNGFIYQLTALGSEGEAMIDSFVPYIP